LDTVTTFDMGINGIMIDIASAALTPADFAFDVSTTARSGTWAPGPLPSSITVRRGQGLAGSDRVTLIWPDRSIRNTWLRVTTLPTAHTGLSRPDVFYFGSLVGDVRNAPIVGGVFRVNALDLAYLRAGIRNGWDGRFLLDKDVNRDGVINALDVALLKANLGRRIAFFQAPP
jgi:hypothetical protein